MTTPDRLDESVAHALQGVASLRQQVDTLTGQLAGAEHVTIRLTSENQTLTQRLGKAEHERDFYMRWSVDLVARLNTLSGACGQMQAQIDEVVKEARRKAYTPSSGAPVQLTAQEDVILRNLAANLAPEAPDAER